MAWACGCPVPTAWTFTTVENVLVVVVPYLHHFIVYAESASSCIEGYSTGIEGCLKGKIKVLRARLSTVHAAEHLDLLHGIETETARNPFSAKLDYRLQRLLRVFSVNEIEIHFLAACGSQIGEGALPDEVCVCNDAALAGLPKYLCQTNYRELARIDNITQHVSWTHGGVGQRRPPGRERPGKGRSQISLRATDCTLPALRPALTFSHKRGEIMYPTSRSRIRLACCAS